VGRTSTDQDVEADRLKAKEGDDRPPVATHVPHDCGDSAFGASIRTIRLRRPITRFRKATMEEADVWLVIP